MKTDIKKNKKKYIRIIIAFFSILFFLIWPIYMLAHHPDEDIGSYLETSKVTETTTETQFPFAIKQIEPIKQHSYEQPTNKLYSVFEQVNQEKSKNKEVQNIKKLERKARKKINFKASEPYKVKINRVENFVMVYGIDIHGKYSIPYKCFVCSSAKNINNTLLGKYRLNDRYRWHSMVDGSYAQYAIRFYDKLMLHSVPYFKKSPDSLEIKEYNKLGHFASLGCIRMSVSDIKWIYDNCEYGTEIKIYDKKGETPPIPYITPKKLDEKDYKSHWDPTDPNKKNPWKE